MPKDDIEEAARVAAQEIKQALEKFAIATGLRAGVAASWGTFWQVGAKRSRYTVESVKIRPVFGEIEE